MSYLDKHVLCDLYFSHENRFGPLVRHWTMRFEAKHSYFKQLAHSMGNFVNITYSLATRHQHYQCYLNINTEELPGWEDNMEAGPGQIPLY